MIEQTIPAKLDQLEALSNKIGSLFASRKDIEDADAVTYAAQMAVHELCVNIIEHAYADYEGYIGMKIRLTQTQFIAELCDRGHSFEPEAVAEPALGAPQVRGYGMFLIQSLMDEVRYKSNIGRNTWRLVKEL